MEEAMGRGLHYSIVCSAGTEELPRLSFPSRLAQLIMPWMD